MPKEDAFVSGEWNAACSMCGRKRKASQLVRNWQGMYRCPEHNEERQPQDFVRGVREVITVPWAQPETDTNISVCSLNGQSSIPGWAVPGCEIPGRTYLNPDEGIDYDVPPNCTIYTLTAIPAYAGPGCSIPGEILFPT